MRLPAIAARCASPERTSNVVGWQAGDNLALLSEIHLSNLLQSQGRLVKRLSRDPHRDVANMNLATKSRK